MSLVGRLIFRQLEGSPANASSVYRLIIVIELGYDASYTTLYVHERGVIDQVVAMPLGVEVGVEVNRQRSGTSVTKIDLVDVKTCNTCCKFLLELDECPVCTSSIKLDNENQRVDGNWVVKARRDLQYYENGEVERKIVLQQGFTTTSLTTLPDTPFHDFLTSLQFGDVIDILAWQNGSEIRVLCSATPVRLRNDEFLNLARRIAWN